MQKNITTIIFDLGGVLLDIDPQRTINQFRNLGMPELIQPGGWNYNHQVFLEMEKGTISDNDFRQGINQLLPRQVSFSEIDNAWCAMLIDFNDEKIQLLKKLSSDYSIYLFSNTNRIHQTQFRKIYREKYQEELDDLFIKSYYSNEMLLRKPDPKAFHYVINDSKINPEETLFIDDSEANLEGAKQVGLKTLWLPANRNLNTELRLVLAKS